MAGKSRGCPGTPHPPAAGVVITDQPVSAYVPLAKNDESIVTQYTMTALEELGLLKMDFLGPAESVGDSQYRKAGGPAAARLFH